MMYVGGVGAAVYTLWYFIMSNLKILALGLMVALSAASASASVETPSWDIDTPTWDGHTISR